MSLTFFNYTLYRSLNLKLKLFILKFFKCYKTGIMESSKFFLKKHPFSKNKMLVFLTSPQSLTDKPKYKQTWSQNVPQLFSGNASKQLMSIVCPINRTVTTSYEINTISKKLKTLGFVTFNLQFKKENTLRF